jgi:hypothetical protein
VREALPHGVGGRCGAASVLDLVEHRRPHQSVEGADAGRACDRHHFVDEAGVPHRPLERLHAAHREAHDRSQVADAEALRQEAVLRLDHVTDREVRERRARPRGRIRGRGGLAVAERVDHQHMKVRRVDDSVRAQ